MHNCDRSIRKKLRDAGLPGGTNKSGSFRFRPLEGYDGSTPLPRGSNGGYLDRFGNEWVKGPYHGDPNKDFLFEWDVYLSRQGENTWNLFGSAKTRIDGGLYINVRPDGQLSH